MKSVAWDTWTWRASSLEMMRRKVLPKALRNRLDICLELLRAAFAAGCVMGLLETVKMALWSDIQIWVSHLITILFTVLLVATVCFWALSKEQGLRFLVAAAEERYRLLFESSLTGAYRTTLDGRILDCNASFCLMFGYTACEEVIGKSVEVGYLNPADRAHFIAQLRTEKSLANVEQRFRRADGSIITVLNSATLVEDGPESFVKGTLTDITELRNAEQEQRRLAAIVRCSDDAITSLTLDGKIETWNASAERIFGYSASEITGEPIAILAPDDRQEEFLTILEGIANGHEEHRETIRRRKDGRCIDVALSASPITDATGSVIGCAAIVQDITERKAAERALHKSEVQYRLLFDSNPVPMWVFDQASLRFLAVNRAAISKYGYLEEEFLKMTIASVCPEQACPNLLEHAAQLGSGSRNSESWQHRKKDGTVIDVETVCHDLNFDGVDAMLVAAYDVTDRKTAEARIQHLAYYDALTDLPNRILFLDRLAMGLAGARRRNEKVALLFLDLDRFTIINDSLGRSAGDQILKQIAQRLQKGIREQDTIARIGSDEFGIVLNAVHDLAAAGVTAGRLMELLALPLEIQGRTVSLGCSIGISVFPQHGADADSLIKNAEAAMHCAKDEGRNSFRFFAEAMNGKAAEQLALETGLRSALANHEFFLVYQPEINLASGRMTAMEALIRWRHPELGLVPPDQFIPIAENSGLILPIGEWVLRTACGQLQRWRSEGISIVPVAVNVSAVQFRNGRFCSLVREVLREFCLPPEYLELELTEGLILSNASPTSSVLSELKNLGVRVAIDDFGTGYSSLSYLKQFRVDKLKIDRSFVRDLPADGDNAAITAAIISMAKSLDLSVIGEGVENEEQLTFLRERQCDEVQGYYFSKPVTPDEMKAKLESSCGSCSRA